MMQIITIIAFFLLSIDSFGQNKSWKYLGQIPPNKTAQLFASEIINHMAHSSPTFTPDGKEIYWSTIRENNGTRKIYYVKYKNKSWSKPKITSFSGNYNDDQPFISHDGRKLYFASDRPKKNISDSIDTNLDIWISTRTNKGWGEPKPIDNFIGLWTPSLTRTGTIYFFDNIGGKVGIARSKLMNGKYLTSEYLPPQINQNETQSWTPFIAPDETYLIFSSDREDGFCDGDLYISFHDINKDEWSSPINMGGLINTSKQERCPGVSPDGKYLFFTRWFGPPNHHDLYWIDASIIDDLRKESKKINVN